MLKVLTAATLMMLATTAAHASCYQDATDARCLAIATESSSQIVLQPATAPGQQACPGAGRVISFAKQAEGLFQNDEGTILRTQAQSIEIEMDGSAPNVMSEVSCPQ